MTRKLALPVNRVFQLVLALILTTILLSATRQPNTCTFAQSATTSPTTKVTKHHPNIAIGLKTGHETLLTRTPIQILTFLREASNVLLIGDASGFVGDIEMVDVYNGVFDAARGEYIQRTKMFNGEDALDGRVPQEPREYQRRNQPHPDVRRRAGLDHLNEQPTVENHETLDRFISGEDVGTEGWRRDAHKNLPGFKLLYQRFPAADWFIMVDDDSYVLLENMQSQISSLNASKPYYFGQGNDFIGCDGVKEVGEGPVFAQGGAGIIVCSGALKAMMAVVDDCIVKYHECYAGDIRTGLCLRDAGVRISWELNGFHSIPPNKEFDFSMTPCERPIVFHHVLPIQMQKMHELEQINKGNVTMGAIFQHFQLGMRRTDTQRRGEAYILVKTESWEKCEKECRNHPDCSTWSFRGNNCSMSEFPSPIVLTNGSTSGVIYERYSC